MYINTAKIKKFFTVILAIIVSFLVVYALYCNKSRFYTPETLKYSKVTIDENNDLAEIISAMSDGRSKDRFISEVKKINKLSSIESGAVYGKTLLIPVHQN